MSYQIDVIEGVLPPGGLEKVSAIRFDEAVSPGSVCQTQTAEGSLIEWDGHLTVHLTMTHELGISIRHYLICTHCWQRII